MYPVFTVGHEANGRGVAAQIGDAHAVIGVAELDSTTLIHPGYKATVDGNGNLLISKAN